MSAIPPAASNPESGPPVLILSCYRTGSTLLRYIMDTHPEVYAPPELFLGESARHMATLACGLAGFRYDWEKPGLLADEILAWLHAALVGRLNAATAAKGKRIWCEKTPSNLAPENLPLLRRLLPQARKVCLHRHCLDVTESLVKMSELAELQPFLVASRGQVVAAVVDYWNERTATLLELAAEEPAGCHRIRYEDLVAGPRQVVGELFRFLDLPWDERLLDQVFEARHDRGLQDHYIGWTGSIRSENVGKGGSVQLDGVPEKSIETMRSLLQTLGYPEELRAPAAPPTEAAASVQDVRWLFETHLPARFRAEPSLCASFETMYQFVVGGAAGGSWIVDPRRGQVAAGRSSAVCNVEVAAADLFAIARGGLNPFKAAEQGRLRLRGDIRFPELEKLVRLLRLAAAAPGSSSGAGAAAAPADPADAGAPSPPV
jgi:protein-tyrosine sulfotransferase